MKIRFYVDIPSDGVRIGGTYPWSFCAMSNPGANVARGFTRVAFDVDMPPDLVLPMHDVMAPAGKAAVIEEGTKA